MKRRINIKWVFLLVVCVIAILSACETPDDWSGLKKEYEVALEGQDYAHTERVARRLVEVATERFGAASYKSAFALNKLGIALLQQKEYKEALEVFTQGLQVATAIGVEYTQERATAVSNIATCYWYVGNVEKAENEIKKSLALYEQVSEKSYDSYTTALVTALGVYRTQGKYEEAEEIGKKAIAILNAHDLKGKGEKSITILTSLALTYIDIGKYHEADTLLQTAFNVAKADSNISDTLKAKVMETGAQLLMETKNYTQAEELFTTALNVLERLLGKNHEDIAIVLNDMGLLYSKMGDNVKADSLFTTALSIYEHNGSLMSLQASTIYHNLGFICMEKGEYLRSEEFFKKAIAIKEATLGKDSPGLISSLRALVSLYEKMDKTSEVTALQERLKKIHSTRTVI